MSIKNNAKRQAYQKKQAEQGRNVVMWIIGALIVLAVVFLFWTTYNS
jgi:ABC-type multidrug transport system permease subunit